MNPKLMLVGEPMGLFIAQTEGPLESVKSYSTAVAGAEFNVAVGLSRLGHTVGYMTKLGKDPFGRQIVNTMEQNRIDTSLITYSEERSTGLMLKSKVSAGDPEIFYYRRNSAASSIRPEDIEKIHMEDYRYLHMTGIFPALSPSTLEAAGALVHKAKQNGLTVFFDPNLRPQLWGDKAAMVDRLNELASLADYFLPGVKEGAVLTGGLTAPESIADFYQERGIPNIIVKVGPQGAFFATKKERGYMPTYEIEKIVDTVGAGDGFAAGVISAVMEGLPIREAVDRGNAIGSIQVMSAGDNEGLPDREQLAAFQEKHKRMNTAQRG